MHEMNMICNIKKETNSRGKCETVDLYNYFDSRNLATLECTGFSCELIEN